MDNLLQLSTQEIVNATSGKLLNPTAQQDQYSEMVFDSRKVTKNSIFLCIKGERVDAHDLIADTVSKGATLIVGDHDQKLTQAAKDFPQIAFVSTSDSLSALQNIARMYRKRFSIPVIGLTGSSGKTTTKDLTSAILKVSNQALVTEGNLNNHWGVPQMIMRLRNEHRAAVFEMGISGFDELANLCTMSQPDIGYITTIGAAHLEFLKSLDGVLKAKRELFDWIIENSKASNRALVFNIDDLHIKNLYEEISSRKDKNLKLYSISQTSKDADVYLVQSEGLGMEHRYGWRYEFHTPWGTIKGLLPLPGAHNLANALAAATMALSSGVANVSDVAEGLSHPELSKLRSDLFRISSGAVVYNDTYNANPTSVSALFEAARLIRSNPNANINRVIAVVGDMLELGPESTQIHRKMGRLAAVEGIDLLLATGRFGHYWIEGYTAEKRSSPGIALDFESQEELLVALNDELDGNSETTLMLVKGSRGAKMDQIVEKIK